MLPNTDSNRLRSIAQAHHDRFSQVFGDRRGWHGPGGRDDALVISPSNRGRRHATVAAMVKGWGSSLRWLCSADSVPWWLPVMLAFLLPQLV